MADQNDPVLDPEGGHDPEALKKAAEGMHAKTETGEQAGDADPEGGHDPEALEEGAERMRAKP